MPTTEVIVREYLKRIQPKLTDPFLPHPIVKAIALALDSSRGGKDGNYVGVSGDADMHHGTPHLSYSVVVEKRGESFKILEMRDIMNNVIISSDTLRKIVDAEIEMLNFTGDSIPVDIAVRILDVALSPKTKVIKLDEKDREAAIELAKQFVDQGKLLDTPPEVVREIKTFRDSSEWNNLSSGTRSTIGSIWGTRIAPNTMVITHVEEAASKLKIREIIALTLARLQ